ncbi:MAG: response regulator [Methyloprofundus sp.]|nr:response regulator [Methyloprofundus sp.]
MSFAQSILCIDDDPINNEVVSDFLEDQYDVVCVSNGQEGLDSIAVQQPDLILLDVLMPVMSGEETIKQLRASASTKDIPVIVISVLSHTIEINHMYELGANQYITKPFRQKELKEVIATLVG